MRRRLVLVVLAATAALPVSPTAASERYDRQCAGAVDTKCYHDFCGFYDCTRSDCHIYSGVFGDDNNGICIGKEQPRDPES